VSDGHVVEPPVHTSGMSQELPPTDGRQIVIDAAVTVPQVPFEGAPAAVLQA
jgi:hypothetical protein